MLRFAFDDPREIGPLLPGVEDSYTDFYDGIQPYTFADFHGDLMRVTSGQTDPALSRILVGNSKDTVFWMNHVGGIPMEPAIRLTGVRKGDKVIWARGLVVRAEHEGVGLSTHWFKTVERMGIEVRYGAAAAPTVILGCGGFEANVQMRTQHIGPLVGAAKVRGTPHNQGDGLRMAMAIGCHAVGPMERLPRNPDLLVSTFYWNRNDPSRAFSQRAFDAGFDRGMRPNMSHAACYAGAAHYLKAVAALGAAEGKRSGAAVVARMKQMPIESEVYDSGSIRGDGRAITPACLFEIKTPAESKADWDYHNLLQTVPADQAWRPLSEGGCPLVHS